MKTENNKCSAALICCIVSSFFIMSHYKALAFTLKNPVWIDTSKYKILRNDPGHIPKTFAGLAPISAFMNSYGPTATGVSLDASRDVIPRLKISASLSIAYPSGLIPVQYSTKFGSSLSINPWYNAEIRGTFFFMNKLIKGKQTIDVAPGGASHLTYQNTVSAPRSALHLTFENVDKVVKLGPQGGYIQSNSTVSGKDINAAGFQSGDFATNLETRTLFVGINYEVIKDLLVNVYQYQVGKLKERSRSKWYADLLLGTSHKVSDVIISGVSYDINNTLNYSNVGFRLGFNYDYINPIGFYYSFEAGSMPGLIGTVSPFKGAFFMIKAGIGASFL